MSLEATLTVDENNVLTKHVTLVEYSDDHVGTVYFDTPQAKSEEDESGWWASRKELTISRELWEELGSPETLTITLEPGDKLNV